jgi:hypothetical protein
MGEFGGGPPAAQPSKAEEITDKSNGAEVVFRKKKKQPAFWGVDEIRAAEKQVSNTIIEYG